MAARGMGVIYQKTSEGRPLRRPISGQERQALLDRWYWPHHRRLENAVAGALCVHGQCLLIDCHSFPSSPLPYEPDQNPSRPDICLGTDEYHTLAELLEAAIGAFLQEGLDVAVDRPFSGALVPLSRYRRDKRVSALMIEVSRGLYLDERSREWSYHRTSADFTAFETDKPSPSGLAAAGCGIYFWEDIRLAEPFAGEDGRVINAEITLSTPAIMDPGETPGQEASAAEAADFTRALVEAGHDGLIVEHPFSGREIVAFDLTAIRVIDPRVSLAERSAARKK